MNGDKNKNLLIILTGPPGAGKSYLAEMLKMGLSEYSVVILEGDAVWKDLFPKPTYSKEEGKIVHLIIHKRALDELRQGNIVIYDATNLKELYRQSARNIAHKAGVPFIIVRVTANEDITKKRLDTRSGIEGNKSDASYKIHLEMKQTEEPIVGDFYNFENDECFPAKLYELIHIIKKRLE